MENQEVTKSKIDNIIDDNDLQNKLGQLSENRRQLQQLDQRILSTLTNLEKMKKARETWAIRDKQLQEECRAKLESIMI
jgi:hypothetical protein